MGAAKNINHKPCEFMMLKSAGCSATANDIDNAMMIKSTDATTIRFLLRDKDRKTSVILSLYFLMLISFIHIGHSV